MDTNTQQFVYRWSAVVLGVAVLGTLVFICCVAISQGDGEAVKLADTLTPWLLGALAALMGALFGHQALAVFVAKYAAIAAVSAATAAAAATAPAAAPVAPAAVAVPSVAPQDAPQPIPAHASGGMVVTTTTTTPVPAVAGSGI